MADDGLVFVCIQCGHGCATYEDLTDHTEDHEDQKPDVHQLRGRARFSGRIKKRNAKQNNDLRAEDVKDFKIEGENRRTTAYTYPSYISMGADSLDSLDTNWSCGQEETNKTQLGFDDTSNMASSLPTMAFSHVNNNINNNNKPELGKRTKKNTKLSKKRKESNGNSNVNGVKKKKNSAKKQKVEAKEIVRRRSTNSMRLRKLTAGGEVCHDESPDYSDSDRFVDVIQRSKIETTLSDIKNELGEKKLRNTDVIKTKKLVNWKKVERLQSRFGRNKTANGKSFSRSENTAKSKGKTAINFQGSINGGKIKKGSKLRIPSKKSTATPSTKSQNNKNASVVNKVKAQMILKRGANTLKSMPLSGKITPIQGPMIWKLVNANQEDKSNGLVLPSIEQLKNNATLKFTDEQKVMITFSQNNDSKSSSLKTIIANVGSKSKSSSKNSSGVRTHQAVLMPVGSLRETGLNNSISGISNNVPIKLLRSTVKKANLSNLSNYTIIPLSSIISSNSTSVSQANLLSTNQKYVSRSVTSRSKATLKSAVSASTLLSTSVASACTSPASSLSHAKSIAKTPSKICITTTTTLTTLQSNLKPVIINSSQPIIGNPGNGVTIAKVTTKSQTPFTSTFNQGARTLVIKQASKSQQILSFLPATGSSSIPTFQLVPRITTTLAPKTQPTTSYNIQTAQLLRPLIIAPRFSTPSSSTSVTHCSTNQSDSSNTRTIYLTTNNLNAAMKNQGIQLTLSSNKSLVAGSIPLVLTAQKTIPDKNKSSKTTQIALSTSNVVNPTVTATQVKTVAQIKQAKVIQNQRAAAVKTTTHCQPLPVIPISAPPQPALAAWQPAISIAPSQQQHIPSQAVILTKTIPTVKFSAGSKNNEISSPIQTFSVCSKSLSSAQKLPGSAVASSFAMGSLNLGKTAPVITIANSSSCVNITNEITIQKQSSGFTTSLNENVHFSSIENQTIVTASPQHNSSLMHGNMQSQVSLVSLGLESPCPRYVQSCSKDLQIMDSTGVKSLVSKIPLSMLNRSKASDYKSCSLANTKRVILSEPSIVSQSRPIMSSGFSNISASHSESSAGMLTKVYAPVTISPAITMPSGPSALPLTGNMIRLVPVPLQTTASRNIEIRPAVSINLSNQNLKPITTLPVVNTSVIKTTQASQMATVTSSIAIVKPSETDSTPPAVTSSYSFANKHPKSLPISIKLTSFASGDILRNSKFLNSISNTTDPLRILKCQDFSRPVIKPQQIPLLPKPTQCMVTFYSSAPKSSIAPQVQAKSSNSVPPATAIQQFPLTYLTSLPVQQFTNGTNLPSTPPVTQSSQRSIYPSSFTSFPQVTVTNNTSNMALSRPTMVIPVTLQNAKMNQYSMPSTMFLTPVYSVVSSANVNNNNQSTNQIVLNQPPIFYPPLSTTSRLQKIAPYPTTSVINIQYNPAVCQSMNNLAMLNQRKGVVPSSITQQKGSLLAAKPLILPYQSISQNIAITVAASASAPTGSTNIHTVNSVSLTPTINLGKHVNVSEAKTSVNAIDIGRHSQVITSISAVNPVSVTRQDQACESTSKEHKICSGNQGQAVGTVFQGANSLTESAVNSPAVGTAMNTSSMNTSNRTTSDQGLSTSSAALVNTVNSIASPIPHAAADLTNSLQSILKTSIKQGSTITINIQGMPVTYALKDGQVFVVPHDKPAKKEEPDVIQTNTEPSATVLQDRKSDVTESSVTVSVVSTNNQPSESVVNNQTQSTSALEPHKITPFSSTVAGKKLVRASSVPCSKLPISVPTALLEKKPRKRNLSSDCTPSTTYEQLNTSDNQMKASPQSSQWLTSVPEYETECWGHPGANNTLFYTNSQTTLPGSSENNRKRKNTDKDVKFGFECDICSRKFDTYNLMWRHRKVHLDETYHASKPTGTQLPRALCPKFAVCQFCNKWFRDKADLERHLVEDNCQNMNSVYLIPSPEEQCTVASVGEYMATMNEPIDEPQTIYENQPANLARSRFETQLANEAETRYETQPANEAQTRYQTQPVNEPLTISKSQTVSENSTMYETQTVSENSTMYETQSNSLNSFSNQSDFSCCDISSLATASDTLTASEPMEIELIGDILNNYDYDDQNQVFEDATDDVKDVKHSDDVTYFDDVKPVIKHAKKPSRTSSKTSMSGKGNPSRRPSSTGKNCALQKRSKRRSRITISDDEEELQDNVVLDLDGEFIATGKLYGEFTCSRCDRGFQNEGELDEHNETFHDSLRYNFRERRSFSAVDYLEDYEEEFE